MAVRWTRLGTCFTVLAAVVAATAVVSPSTAFAAGTPQSPGASLSPRAGQSGTTFNMSLPTGAACPGDSTNSGYRWQTYMVPSTVDPSTLQFGSTGPVGAGNHPLFDTTGAPVVNQQTANQTTTGGPGVIQNIPAMNYAVFTPGQIPAGVYNIGIACTLGGASTTQESSFWNKQITVTANGAATPGTDPAAFNWQGGTSWFQVALNTVTPGNATLTAWFTPTAADPAVSSYTATATPHLGGFPVTATGVATATSITISGLTNNTLYDVTVHGTNSIGNSPESNIVQGTPAHQAVTNLVATPVFQEVDLTWTAPPASDGTPTGYLVHVGRVNAADPPPPADQFVTTTSAIVKPVTPGFVYQFVVTPTYPPPDTGTASSVTAACMCGQAIALQDIVVNRPVGALVLTQVCRAGTAPVQSLGSVSSYGDPTINNPRGIALGIDGALWFTNLSGNSIGRIDPTTKRIDTYTDPSISGPIKIQLGPDHAMWFTNINGNSIGRIDLTTHAITSYSDTSVQGPQGIWAGPDGAMWFTNFSGSSIGRIDPTTHAISSYSDPSVNAPVGIVTGQDGALWFANYNGNSIGRISPTSHVITTYTDATVKGPRLVTEGSDGALWFTNTQGSTIGRIDPYSHAIDNVSDPVIVGPTQIVTGPDGALWFATGSNSIGRLDIGSRRVTSYPTGDLTYPVGVVSGPDNAVWVTNTRANTISRVQAVALNDPQFPDYPYPQNPDGTPAPTYPTHCGIDLGNAKFLTTGPGAGQFFAASGALNQVTIVDTRDVDQGWTVSGSMSDFSAGPGKSFSGSELGWTPLRTSQTPPFTDSSGNSYAQTTTAGADVAPNSPVAAGLSTGRTLGLAAARSGTSPNFTGGLGTAVFDARIKLLIPVTAQSGMYGATLTITAV